MYEVVTDSDDIDVVSVRGGFASLRDRQYLARQIVVDSAGRQVDEHILRTTPTTYSVLLNRVGSQWYLASVER